MSDPIDWSGLTAEATAVAGRAHAPYSRLHVGAAGLTDTGRIVLGANVENASYGLTFCAEVSLVGAVVSGGAGRLVAVAITDDRGTPLLPCGRCRQILHEMGGPDLAINVEHTAASLLPHAFVADDLP